MKDFTNHRSHLNLQYSTKILAALTFIIVISSCPCATIEERFIQIPALKRVAQLGHLYNEKTDSFINAYVFKGTIPKELITEIQIPDSRTYTGIMDSLIDTYNFFSIDKNTAVNILAGITNPEGALSLIKPGQSSPSSQTVTSTSTGTLLYKYKTVIQNLESFHDKLKDNYNTDIVEHKQATHVVTSISWGCQVAVQVELNSNSTDTKNHSRISRNLLRAELRSLRRGEPSAFPSNFSMTVRSDIPLPTEFPTTGQEVKEMLTQVPNLVGGLNEGKGIPLGYTLTPINLIRNHLGLDHQNTSAVKLNEFTLNELIEVFQELQSAEMELHQLNEKITSYSNCISQETGIELIDFQSKLRKFKTNFTTAVKHSLIQVRSGLSENTILTDLVVGFRESDFERENFRYQIKNNFDISNGNEIEFCSNFQFYKNLNETSVCQCPNQNNLTTVIKPNTDECAHPGTCSVCVKKPTPKCSCREGYVKDARDPTKCQSSTSDNATLLFGTPRGIQQYSIGRIKMMTQLISETSLHRALDFHYPTQTMFWGGTDQKIYSAPILVGASKTLVLHVPGSSIHSIAIDWVHDHLYVADHGKNKIFLVNLDGSMKKIVINDGLDHPTSIVVNPLNGWMYWVDWAKKRIERAGMDGSGRQVIATTPYDHPNGLALDYTENRLYWTTYAHHPCLIVSMNPDGSDQRIVLRAAGPPFSGSQFWSITIFENHMYWRDQTTSKIYRANKCNGEGVTELISESQHHRSVQAYHFSKQPQVPNQCANRILQCSHLCLPIPGIGNESVSTICACPDDRTLSYDRHTCL